MSYNTLIHTQALLMLTGNDLLTAVQNLPSMVNTNPIIPKVAYIPLKYTLSVDDFLKMWEQFFQETEGNPTQKDYDKMLKKGAFLYFYDMREEIEDNIRLMEDN